MMKLLVTLTVLLSSFVATSVSLADTIDQQVLREMQQQKIPGVSIAVVHKGKIIKEQGYGLANVEHQVKVSPQTIFQSGSVGKQFTAALILLLARDGKLSLQDPIEKHLESIPDHWKGITIHQLLTHTSGLDDPYRKLDFKKNYTDQELIDLEATVPMLFKPGEKWQYSNMGYHVLGFIANKVGGQFYGDQLRQRIFEPLGMQTRIIDERSIIPHRAAGYDLVKREWKNQEWVSPALNRTADGSLYLTAHDLALWDLALYKNFPLTQEEKQLSWSPVKLKDGSSFDYGYAWFLSNTNGHKNIEHGGAWQGFTTQISRYVDDQLSVIVLTNRSGANPKRIADLIAGVVLPALKMKPVSAIPDTDTQSTARAKEVLQQIIKGSITPDIFSEKAAKALFPEPIRGLAEDLKEFGEIVSIELLKSDQQNGQTKRDYRVKMKHESFIYRIGFDADAKVFMINVRPE